MTRPGPCGHIHDDPMDALACNTTQALHRATRTAAGTILLGEDFRPSVAILSNVAGMAIMATAICELALAIPRPTDCENCAAAWDRMQQAVALLRPTKMGRC